MTQVGDRVKVKDTYQHKELIGQEGTITELPCRYNPYDSHHAVTVRLDNGVYCFSRAELLIRKNHAT